MKPTRRTVLGGLAGLGAGCGAGAPPKHSPSSSPEGSPEVPPPAPSPSAPGTTATTTPTASTPSSPGPEPAAPWNPPGTVDLTTFACGVQTGDALPDAVLVACRQFDEATLEVVLARGVADGWEEVQRLPGLVPTRNVVRVELTGLVPDTTYAVVAYAPDGVRRTPPARFRTALAAGTSRTVRFGATSCLGSPGAPWASLSRVAGLKLDFFLLLGDTIYADEGFAPAGQYPEHWTNALSTSGLRDLALSTSLVATWDDHEVNNDWNWSDDGDLVPDALQAYQDGVPQRPGRGAAGIWRSLRWGEVVELFVLECRGERTDGRYVSVEQMDWLKAALQASTARFKVVLNSVPITDLEDAYFGSSDVGWNAFPTQRNELLGWLADQQVGGVLFVTGDVHWGTIATVGKPGTRDAGRWEVFCGPAGSTINLLAITVDPDAQFADVWFDWNTVNFEADPVAGTVTVRVEGDAGTLVTRVLTV